MKKLLLLSFLIATAMLNAQIKLTYVNPATNEIKIKNFGTAAVDITNYRFCALFEYANIPIGSVSIVSGDLNLSANEEVTVAWNSSTGFTSSPSDVGLYLPTGAFTATSAMVDFMEYGGAGLGRENVANAAGLWTAGQFLTGAGPWYYIGNGTASGLTQWSDQPPVVGPNLSVRINELDPDQPNTDTMEFIELIGEAGTSLDGLVIVFFSGANNSSYAAYDLDGMTISPSGFFVLGSALVPNVNMELTDASNAIQNGQDAVAIYAGNATDWTTGTLVVATNLVDAIVYGTDDEEDAELIAALAPGQTQANAAGNDAFSFSRVPDGGAAFDLSTYLVQTPTPGGSNIPQCSGGLVAVDSGSVSQCSDQDDDLLVITNNSVYGDFYLYILADAAGLILSTNTDGSFDLNTLGNGAYQIWGFSFNGILNEATIAAGQPASGVMSDNCYSFSTNNIAVEVLTCIASQCDGGVIQASNGNTYISLCSDDVADEYSFTAVASGNADYYGYVITDVNGLIVQLFEGNTFDFNALVEGSYLVHGLSYFATIDPTSSEAGDPVNGLSTSGQCLDLSDNTVQVEVLNCTLGEGCTRLYFSEYLEGTSNNKALEIYNPTPFPVDLSDYDVASYANGSVDFTSVIALEGILQPGDVYVIANSQAAAEILAVADITAGLATFSGNDAIVLLYDLEQIDVIGVIGVDPGNTGWQFGIGSTTDHDLVRNLNVNSPTTNWALSQGQWTVNTPFDYSHLGDHAALACSGEAFVSFEVAALQVPEDAGTLNIVVNAFNISVDVPITVNISSSSATEGADYTSSLPVTLTFTPENNSQTISISIVDDLEEEDLYEYVTITLNDDNDLATLVNESITISIEPSDQDYPLYTIEQIHHEGDDGSADSLDVFCSIAGIVHGINYNPNGTEFTLIQGIAGIKVFDSDENFGYTVQEGDSIIVSGQVTQFMGMTEFFPDTIVLVDGGHTLEVPTLLTSISEVNESHMVKMTCVELADPTQWTQTGSGFDVDLTDGTNTFVMHVDLNTDLFAAAAPEGHFDVVGIGGQSDPDSPYDSGYVFWPRAITDVSDNVIASFMAPADIIYTDQGSVVDFVNQSSGAINYSWDFGDGNSSTAMDVNHDYSYAFLSDVSEVTISLEVTGANGCIDTFSTTVNAIFSSVQEENSMLLSVYPNPAVDVLNVQSNETIQEYRIINSNGALVEMKNNIGKLNAAFSIIELPSGLYHLKVETMSGVKTIRFMVR